MPTDRPLLVEGARLPPQDVYQMVSDTRKALWLVPSREFLQAYLAKRENVVEALKEYPDPERAFENLVSSYFEIGNYISGSATTLGLRVISIENVEDINRSVETISRHFGLQ